MSESNDNNGSVFVDRRKMPEDLRSVLSNEIQDLNRRRDDSLKIKLDAIVAYHNLCLSTKADALNTAITRIQGDTSACAYRCAKQVAEFYNLINEIKQNQVREIEKFISHETHSDRRFGDLVKFVKELDEKVTDTRKELDEKIDSLEKDTEKEHGDLKTRFTVLENWKAMNWKQTLIWGACALVALMQVLHWLGEKLKIVP